MVHTNKKTRFFLKTAQQTDISYRVAGSLSGLQDNTVTN